MTTPEPPRCGMPELMLAFGAAIAIIAVIVCTVVHR